MYFFLEINRYICKVHIVYFNSLFRPHQKKEPKLKKVMTPLEIKFALEKAGFTQIKVADALGVSQPMVNLVINDRATSHRIRCYIAGVIGRPVSEIWKVRKNPTKPGRPLTRLTA